MVRLNCTLTALQKKRITVNHSLDNIEIAGRYALVWWVKESGEQRNKG